MRCQTSCVKHLRSADQSGITFSPDGKYAYIADTGAGLVCPLDFDGLKPPLTFRDSTGTIRPIRLPCKCRIRLNGPCSTADRSYRFDVEDDGTWSGRKTFAYVTPGLPDGIHCDDKGNVYAGCGDGIQVWNPSGKLIGKIFIGETSANFRESPLTTRLDLYR